MIIVFFLTWLKEHRLADGSWFCVNYITSLSVLALIEARKNGSWSTYLPGSGDVGCVSVTAHAIEALITAGEMKSEIPRAILWLRKNMNKNGYWNDLWPAKNTYGTACALSALIKAGQGDCIEVERGINWLRQAQNSDGD